MGEGLKRAFAAARATRKKKSDWQPIETAPKDGEFILAVMASGHIKILQWAGFPAGGYWRGAIYDGPGDWTPTHWMPLPNPPAGKNNG